MNSFIDKVKEKETRKYAPIYELCNERGVPVHFCKLFATRMEYYPLNQTKAFLKVLNSVNSGTKSNYSLDELTVQINNWKKLLKIYINIFPNDKFTSERIEAIELIDKSMKE